VRAACVIASRADVERVDATLLPGILKTARLGYDGKGQRTVTTAPRSPPRSRRSARCRACSSGGSRSPARSASSSRATRAATVVHLPVHDNVHAGGILAVTRVPARGHVGAATQIEAIALAERLARALDYVGVLCVEFFVVEGGALVANEMAPRPHNSGHHSIDSCDVSQFELQVRTLAGAPLVAPRQHSAAVMLNLLGDLWTDGVAPDWSRVLALPERTCTSTARTTRVPAARWAT
jgi:5-(carboxyamino)imidazole ribonucleotide synthase